jgi:multiple sugar transport system substrate-binding protein
VNSYRVSQTRSRGWRPGAVALVIAFLAGACGATASPSPANTPAGGTTASASASAAAGGGITMTMWGRSVDQKVYEAVVAEWNKTHANQIKLTLIPPAEYIAKVTAAAAGGQLPDLLDVDLIYMPDFINQGLLQPITEKVNGYAHKADLSPGHVQVSTSDDGKIYGVPFYVDASSLFWNKDLYRKAGLDPEKPPTTWAEVLDHAKKIRALGSDTYGFYFAGGGAGPNAYTYLPQIWAAGGDVIDYTAHKAIMGTNPIVKEAFQYYRDLYKAGVMPEAVKAEDGTNWPVTFATGKIGIQPLGGGWGIRIVKEKNPSMNFGVTYLPGKESGQKASFAGGDTIAVTTKAKDVNAAWEFIEWSLSDNVQLEFYAKNGAFTSRTDLASNKYSDADPRYVLNNQALKQGQTPRTLGYNEIFNDVNGPWLAAIRKAVFDGDVNGAVSTGNDAIQAILDTHYK